MTESVDSKKKIITVLFPHDTEPLRRDVASKKVPSERLYGFKELEELDEFEIKYTDYRYRGINKYLLSFLRSYDLHPVTFRCVIDFIRSDIVIIKDDFSFSASLVCKLLGIPVIYYDSLFEIPENNIKRSLVKFVIRSARSIICYSKEQANIFAKFASVDDNKFKIIEFALDPQFYRLKDFSDSKHPYVLSVGRDSGRDFNTLIKSCEAVDMKLKLVTVPYILETIRFDKDIVEIYQNVSYEKLFELYSHAMTIVVPLKKGIDYPSGIRAVMESLSLKKPVIVSATKFIKSNIKTSKVIKFVEPNNINELSQSILDGFLEHNDNDFLKITPSYSKNINDVIEIIRNTLV